VSALQKLFADSLGSGYAQIELNSLLHGDASAVAKAIENGINVDAGSFFDMTFLKIFDLGVAPWQCISQKEWQYWPLLLIPFVMLGTQYIMQMLSQPKKKKDKKDEDPTMRSMNLMMKMMPLMTFVIAFIAPAGLGFYWTIGNLLSMLQTVIINKFFIKKKED
jgi:YidC/Oxa1 family membrane protein insertase